MLLTPSVMTSSMQCRSLPRCHHVGIIPLSCLRWRRACARGCYCLPWHLIISNSLSQTACHLSAALSTPCHSGECDLSSAVRGKHARSSGPVAGRMPPVDQGEASAYASGTDSLPKGAHLAAITSLTWSSEVHHQSLTPIRDCCACMRRARRFGDAARVPFVPNRRDGGGHSAIERQNLRGNYTRMALPAH